MAGGAKVSLKLRGGVIIALDRLCGQGGQSMNQTRRTPTPIGMFAPRDIHTGLRTLRPCSESRP